MNNKEDTASPIKLFHKVALEVKAYNCIVCGKRAGNENLRTPGQKGLATFVSALQIRGECNGFPKHAYSNIFDFDNKSLNTGITDVRWHPKCYSSFTNSTNLSYFTTESESTPETSEKPATRSQKPLINLQTAYMFCGFRQHHNDTKLILLQHSHVIRKIYDKCEAIYDEQFKWKIGGDFFNLPAYDAKYHLKCLNKYMSKTTDQNNRTESVHDTAFKELIKFIDPLLEEGRALELPSLLVKFKTCLKDVDYEHFESYTTQKLKNRLSKHYGSKIILTDCINTLQSIYSSDISIADAINIAANYKQALKDNELINVDETENIILDRAAEILLKKIQEVDGISINPLSPEDISTTAVTHIVPEQLREFLNRICSSNRGKGKSKKILSISQDIIALQSSGRKKMPKQVGLAISLKRSVRYKEFITYLNNLGHSICYDDVLRIDTSWEMGLVEAGDGYATIPTNIHSNIFTQAAFDNGDYGQENTSQHVTNTVLYQYTQSMFGNVNVKIPCSKSRRRSINLLPTSLEELTFVQKPELPRSYSNFQFDQAFSESLTRSYYTTISWILLRHVSSKLCTVHCKQVVPQWTAFRKIASVKITLPTTIGNYRTVPAPPTDINAVYTVLINVKKMLCSIGQEDTCGTVDESIYQIANQIQWKVPALQDITGRLAGFHRAKNFLGVIGKRMKSSGFSEILEEANVYGAKQIEGW